MSASSFDPAQTVRFDVSKGAVSLDGVGRAVLLSEGALESLLAAAGEAASDVLRALGKSLGAAVRAGLPDDASPEIAVHHASGHLGRAGFGTLRAETWGPALALGLEGAPSGLTGERAGALLGGLVSAIVEREVALVSVGGVHLVVSPSERASIAARAKDARGIADVVAFLAEGGAA